MPADRYVNAVAGQRPDRVSRPVRMARSGRGSGGDGVHRDTLNEASLRVTVTSGSSPCIPSWTLAPHRQPRSSSTPVLSPNWSTGAPMRSSMER